MRGLSKTTTTIETYGRKKSRGIGFGTWLILILIALSLMAVFAHATR
jgi:hypothetical protein